VRAELESIFGSSGVWQGPVVEARTA